MTDTETFSVQMAHIFCEDFRVEENGKPMFIGVLSPVLASETDITLDDIYLISIVNIPSNIEEIQLDLEMTDPQEDGETHILHKHITRKETEQSGETWSVILPAQISMTLPLNGPYFEAILRSEGAAIRSTLQARSIEAEE